MCQGLSTTIIMQMSITRWSCTNHSVVMTMRIYSCSFHSQSTVMFMSETIFSSTMMSMMRKSSEGQLIWIILIVLTQWLISIMVVVTTIIKTCHFFSLNNNNINNSRYHYKCNNEMNITHWCQVVQSIVWIIAYHSLTHHKQPLRQQHQLSVSPYREIILLATTVTLMITITITSTVLIDIIPCTRMKITSQKI